MFSIQRASTGPSQTIHLWSSVVSYRGGGGEGEGRRRGRVIENGEGKRREREREGGMMERKEGTARD